MIAFGSVPPRGPVFDGTPTHVHLHRAFAWYQQYPNLLNKPGHRVLTALSHKSPRTLDVYQRVLRDFLLRLTQRSEYTSFPLNQLTRTMVETYMTSFEEAEYSVSHRTRVKSVLSRFCQWLIDEYGLLKRNPTRGLELPMQQILAPRILSEEQRFILRTL